MATHRCITESSTVTGPATQQQRSGRRGIQHSPNVLVRFAATIIFSPRFRERMFWESGLGKENVQRCSEIFIDECSFLRPAFSAPENGTKMPSNQ